MTCVWVAVGDVVDVVVGVNVEVAVGPPTVAEFMVMVGTRMIGVPVEAAWVRSTANVRAEDV